MKMCDCNQGRLPCTCKMAPKLVVAVKRFGSPLDTAITAYPRNLYGRVLPENIESVLKRDLRVALGDHETPECFCVEHGAHIERLKKEVDALQDLLSQRDMEIDYLATARPTTLRLDWYLIGLATIVNVAFHYGFLQAY